MHNSTEPGDMVAFRRGDKADSHALVLEVIPQGEKLRVTHGSAHESELVNMEDAIKVASAGGSALHRRLAYSMTQVPKILEEKDQQRDQYAAEVTRANTLIAEMREFLIARFEDQTLPKDVLDDFLARFGLEPYRKRWEVRAAVTLVLDVEDAATEELATDKAFEFIEAALHKNEIPDGVIFGNTIKYRYETVRIVQEVKS